MRKYVSFVWPPLLCFVLIVIGSWAEHPEQHGLQDYKKILEEIGLVGKYALALWIASVPIKEAIENALKDGARDVKDSIDSKLGETGNKVTAGFGNLTTAVQSGLLQMQVNLQLVRDDRSLKQSDDDVAKMVPDPATLSLARAGKASEAIAKIDAGKADPKLKAQQEIAVLILSSNESDWELAATRLEAEANPDTDSFHRLSFKFWSANHVDRAIQLAEEGLAVAGKSPHGQTVSLELKNNLAYFYAEANRTDKKAEAFEYIHEARQQWPLNAEIFETEACVKIAFGTKEEALNGIAQCMEAARAKNDYTTFDHWLKRYNERTF